MSPITPGSSTSTNPTTGPTPGNAASPPQPDVPLLRAVPRATSPRASTADRYAADGRSTRWADHREARRGELVRIARRTVHHRGPDVSMEEIASAAGTSKSIVYRYFADKTGLQIAVAEAVVLQIQGALEGVLRVSPTPREGLRAMVAVYLEMIESSPNVYQFVTRNGSVESGGPLGHFLDSVTQLVAAPFARGLTHDTADGQRARRPEAEAHEPGTDAPQADESVAHARDPRISLAESWAAGAVGFVRGAGEWWLAHRDEPGSPDRQELTTQVAAWLWAGPVGLLARDHKRDLPPPGHGPRPDEIAFDDIHLDLSSGDQP